MYTTPRHTRGFIALISILIVSAVLLVTTLSLAERGIAHRFHLLALEQKQMSERRAEACVHIARVKIFNDPGYTITESISFPIGDGTCTIHSVTHTGNKTIILATAESGHTITNLRVTVSTPNGDFIAWEETPL